MKLSVHTECWPARTPVRIAGHTQSRFDLVVVELSDGAHVGRGEGAGVFYLDDSAAGALEQIEGVRPALEQGIDRERLRGLLPPGCARNAVDAALWDLQAKREGRRAWDLAGVAPRTLTVQYTLGIEPTPQATAEVAVQAGRGHGQLKIKVDADRPVERVRAVREARPHARLAVDANQAWTLAQLQAFAPALAALDVHMIEQPLRRGEDEGLAHWRSPVPLCADESCQHLGELEQAASRYQLINIKLDKCGGLTEGLALAQAARRRGLGLMVGCMGGTSLSMAPAFVLACLADVADLDGPLWLRADRLPGLDYRAAEVPPFGPSVWG